MCIFQTDAVQEMYSIKIYARTITTSEISHK